MLLSLENAAVKSLEPFQAVRQFLAVLSIFDQQSDVVAIKVKESLELLNPLLLLLVRLPLVPEFVREGTDCLVLL